MPKGEVNAVYGPGWLDVCVYLEELRKSTGRRYRVTIGAPGETADSRCVLLGVQQYYAGSPVFGADDPIIGSYWPNPDARSVEAAVYKLLYRLDRALEERKVAAEQKAFF